jgi:hypothetical protein
VTVRYLSEEWLAEARRLADEHVGASAVSARIEVVVSRAPSGDVAFGWVIEDGAVSECRMGRLPEPDCTFTLPYEEAVRIHRGELDPSVAFMQGKLKIAGYMAKVMELLPVTRGAGYRDWAAALRAVTDA